MKLGVGREPGLVVCCGWRLPHRSTRKPALYVRPMRCLDCAIIALELSIRRRSSKMACSETLIRSCVRCIAATAAVSCVVQPLLDGGKVAIAPSHASPECLLPRISCMCSHVVTTGSFGPQLDRRARHVQRSPRGAGAPFGLSATDARCSSPVDGNNPSHRLRFLKIHRKPRSLASNPEKGPRCDLNLAQPFRRRREQRIAPVPSAAVAICRNRYPRSAGRSPL
jgi:hypothetical protein